MNTYTGCPFVVIHLLEEAYTKQFLANDELPWTVSFVLYMRPSSKQFSLILDRWRNVLSRLELLLNENSI